MTSSTHSYEQTASTTQSQNEIIQRRKVTLSYDDDIITHHPRSHDDVIVPCVRGTPSSRVSWSSRRISVASMSSSSFSTAFTDASGCCCCFASDSKGPEPNELAVLRSSKKERKEKGIVSKEREEGSEEDRGKAELLLLLILVAFLSFLFFLSSSYVCIRSARSSTRLSVFANELTATFSSSLTSRGEV